MSQALCLPGWSQVCEQKLRVSGERLTVLGLQEGLGRWHLRMPGTLQAKKRCHFLREHLIGHKLGPLWAQGAGTGQRGGARPGGLRASPVFWLH